MSQNCCAVKPAPAQNNIRLKLTQYRPIIVITMISLAAAAALSMTNQTHFMNALMGFFLCFLAALKLFNLGGFAMSFAQYDILASRFKFYAFLYPFIELGLGLSYFANLWPTATNTVMLIVMCVSTLGVLKTISSKQSVQCACVGTGFDLPVGYVTLAENTIMGLMAASYLFL